jgi:hypothetical protein
MLQHEAAEIVKQEKDALRADILKEMKKFGKIKGREENFEKLRGVLSDRITNKEFNIYLAMEQKATEKPERKTARNKETAI